MDEIGWPDMPSAKILDIREDGRLELAPNVSIDEASRALWREILKRFSLQTDRLEGVAQAAAHVADDPSEKNLRGLRDALSLLHRPAGGL